MSGPANAGSQSGACSSTPPNNDSYFTAGYEGGQTAAASIDRNYLASGVKPDYLILDPEGYNYGNGPPSQATFYAFINGWALGVRTTDPGLAPGFYANQGQYHANNLAAVNLPAFVAVSPIICNEGGASAGGMCGGVPANWPNQPFYSAFGLGSPGFNITGYIEYGDFGASPPRPTCPAAPYENAIRNWGAPYNTLQFPDSGVDCGP